VRRKTKILCDKVVLKSDKTGLQASGRNYGCLKQIPRKVLNIKRFKEALKVLDNMKSDARSIIFPQLLNLIN
jgi:hypothetical protein